MRIPRLGVPHLQRRAGTTRGLYLGVHRPVGAESFRDGVTTLGLRGVTRNPLREGRNRREQRRVGWGLENDSPIFFIGVFHVGTGWLALGFLNHQRFTGDFFHPQLPNFQPSPSPQKKIHFARCWLIPMGFYPKVFLVVFFWARSIPCDFHESPWLAFEWIFPWHPGTSDGHQLD